MSQLAPDSTSLLQKWLPGVVQLRGYHRAWLRGDLVAGLILTTFLVPQGMAYAELAGLPPVNGLYASMIPLLMYAILGPSRVLILAPDSAIAPLVAGAILPLAGSNMNERVAIAGMLAVMVGILSIVGGVLGVGFLTDLISRPVRAGYLAGIALTVIVAQIPSILGTGSGGDTVVGTLRGFSGGVGHINVQSTAIGLLSLCVLLVLSRVRPSLPGALIIVIATLLVNRALELDVRQVGSLPSGLPRPAVPRPDSLEFEQLAFPAVAIAIMAFADTSILSRSYARRTGSNVDSNQELRALGGANLVAGFFQGFPISSSSSRTPVAEHAGARSPLCGVVGAVALGGILIFAADAFHYLPIAALAAILVVAALRLFDVDEFRRLQRTYLPDFYLAVAAFLGVSLFGVLWGIGIAIVLSIGAFLWRSWHPHVAVLGRAPHVKGYHDITRYTDAVQIPGLLIFRFDAPIFFANAELFRESVMHAVHAAADPVKMVLIAGEPITDLDSTAADMLFELSNDLDELDIELGFAELRDPMRDRLRAFGLVEPIGKERFYLTLGQAVRSYVQESGVRWVDWEDELEAVEGESKPGRQIT